MGLALAHLAARRVNAQHCPRVAVDPRGPSQAALYGYKQIGQLVKRLPAVSHPRDSGLPAGAPGIPMSMVSGGMARMRRKPPWDVEPNLSRCERFALRFAENERSSGVRGTAARLGFALADVAVTAGSLGWPTEIRDTDLHPASCARLLQGKRGPGLAWSGRCATVQRGRRHDGLALRAVHRDCAWPAAEFPRRISTQICGPGLGYLKRGFGIGTSTSYFGRQTCCQRTRNARPAETRRRSAVEAAVATSGPSAPENCWDRRQNRHTYAPRGTPRPLLPSTTRLPFWRTAFHASGRRCN